MKRECRKVNLKPSVDDTNELSLLSSLKLQEHPTRLPVRHDIWGDALHRSWRQPAIWQLCFSARRHKHDDKPGRCNGWHGWPWPWRQRCWWGGRSGAGDWKSSEDLRFLSSNSKLYDIDKISVSSENFFSRKILNVNFALLFVLLFLFL